MNERRDDLLRYLDGALGDEERRAFEEELLDSPERMNEAYEELLVTAAARPLRQRPRPGRRHSAPRPRGKWMWVAPAVAAVVAGIWLWPDRAEQPPVFRGDGGIGLQGIEPLGSVDSSPTRFLWFRDPGATAYRVELVDAQGVVVFARTSTDTTLVVGPEVEPPAIGSWRVLSLDALGVPLRESAWVTYQIEVR